MSQSICLTPLKNIPFVQPGDNVAALILSALERAELSLQDGDVLAIAQKIISKSEGRYARLGEVEPGEQALQVATVTGKDPRLVELILRESEAISRMAPNLLIVRHRLGFTSANAGIDRSNIEQDDDEPVVLLLPEDPDRSAAAIREEIVRTRGAEVAVIALHIYLQETLGERGTLEGTVINLSLGTAEPDEEELPPEARRAIQQMMDLWRYRPLREEGVPVFSLELPMIIAEDLGAVVVAASGNDSAEQAATDPVPSQIPAAYPLVIGVQASNQSMSRSCFANAGDLSAPGGEGGQLPQECRPITDTCKPDDATCEAGVISYVFDAHRGFAFWVGTSFATPLVSGLSALVQESGTTDPAQVQQTVLCSAQADGVVDVVDALNSCP